MSSFNYENEIHTYDAEKHKPWDIGYKIYAALLCILPTAIIIALVSFFS